MARPLRIEFPGAVYHITSRGNARESIFLTNADRQTFITVLATTVEKYNWLCHAYCLMDNHYHLLLETLDPNLSLGMRQLNGVYTQHFNRTHQRVGHVFQGRFKSILVEKQSHLLELCRYVVLNPVRAGIVARPDEWEYSSYCATAYYRLIPDFLTVDWILAQFTTDKAKAKLLYGEFVANGMKKTCKSPWEKLTGQIFLGTKNFITQIEHLLGERQEIREIPRAQRYPGRPPLEKIFTDLSLCTKKARNGLIYQAHKNYGYTLKEIAATIGIHYTTVSKVVKAFGKK